MTTDSNTPVDISDNLDEFENLFFEREAEEPADTVEEEVVEKEVDEIEDDTLATEEDEDAESDEDEDEEDGEEEEEEPEPEPQPKKNRKSAKERIEELVAKNREAERREAELIRRLESLEARSKEVKSEEEAPKALREQLPAEAPNPDALGEDGEPLYALGEFDPKYIRDLTKFTIEQETKAAREAAEREAAQREVEESRKEIETAWVEKLEKAEAEMPDIRENLRNMTETFSHVEPAYGEYLAMTIMSSEYGPHIMYYLSQNIGEAQKIVASGPAAATLALGRLEAKFASVPKEREEPKRNTKRMSKAAEPPEGRTRGHGGKFSTAPDTDDLDAFEREFFGKK
jgi:hypothetical protein